MFLGSLALFPFGAMETRLLETAVRPWRQADANASVVAVREGLTETVIYFQRTMIGKPVSYAMLTNSFSMSATGYGRAAHEALLYWPMAGTDLTRALLIVFGVGNTAKRDRSSASRRLTGRSSRTSLQMLDASIRTRPTPSCPSCPCAVEYGRYFLQTDRSALRPDHGGAAAPGIAGRALSKRGYFQVILTGSTNRIVTYCLPISDRRT